MLTIDMRHVRLRGKSWHYRRVVPPAAREKIGRKYWTHTWRRTTPIHEVYRAAKAMTADHDRMIAVALGKIVDVPAVENVAKEIIGEGRQPVYEYLGWAAAQDHDDDPETNAIVSALEHDGKYVPPAPVLSLALQQDIERYGADRDNYPVRSSVDSFIAVCGDSSVTTISRQSALTWIDSLTAKGYAPATLRKRVGNLRSLLNRTFLDLEIEKPNPFAKHRLKGNGSVTDRLPFNKAMLDRIDGHLANSKRLKPETRHVLQIMRNTGASPKEIGGLVLADISLSGPVPYMWVRVNSQRGIKAAARDRQIPLVGVSLVAMREAVTLAGERAGSESPDTAKLFAGFGGKGGQDAKLISKNINKAVHAAGIPKKTRLSAYSYRHTFEESMRSANIPSHLTDRLMGHTIPGIAGKYGSPRALLAEAKAAIEKSLEHQGRVDESIYSEGERITGT